MPLIKCSECKKEISDKAKECPHCGNPMNLNSIEKLNKASVSAQIKTVLFVTGVILLPVIFAWFTLKKGTKIGARVFALIWMVLWVLVFATSPENTVKVEPTSENEQVAYENEIKPYLLQNKIDFDQLLISAKPSKTVYYDERVESTYVNEDRLEAGWLTIVINIRPESHISGDQFNQLDQILVMLMAQNAIDYLVKNNSNPDVYDFNVKVTARLRGNSPTGQELVYPMGSVRYLSGGTELKYSEDF